MVYVRGHRNDFDNWANILNDQKWSYRQMLPYFKKAQSHELGANLYRGGDGPLQVSNGPMTNPLFDAFIEAGEQAGYRKSEDLNGEHFEGFGLFDRTISNKDGTRCNTATAYLHPVKHRNNLTVETDVLVDKLLVSGSKCTGVRINNWKGNASMDIKAERVVVCGGAINTPQLLELSGIGNHEILSKVDDVELTHHLPGVGESLQDHLEVSVQQECTQAITLYKAQQWWNKPKIGVEWFLNGTGLAASSHFDAGAFVKSEPSKDYADVQFHFVPTQYNDHGQLPPDREAYQIHLCTLRSKAVGSTHIKTSDPRTHPTIDPNYLSHPEDVPDLIKCIKIGREIFAQAAFDEFRSDEYMPGSHVQSDKEIEQWVLDNCNTVYHPCCSAKMGSVVDSSLNLLGIDNLTICDASVMPFITSGNLNAPVIAMAEMTADIMQGKQLLDPIDV